MFRQLRSPLRPRDSWPTTIWQAQSNKQEMSLRRCLIGLTVKSKMHQQILTICLFASSLSSWELFALESFW
jgi:hypothetical protein